MECVYVVSFSLDSSGMLKCAYATREEAVEAARQHFKDNEFLEFSAEPRHQPASALWFGNQAWEVARWKTGSALGAVTVVEMPLHR